MSTSLSENKQWVLNTFNTIAGDYDNAALRFFPITADTLIHLLKPKPGSKLLDVAAGTGVVTQAAAQAIGPSGRVMAIDLSPTMLQKAEANVNKLGLTNVDFFEMDIESLDFKSDYFDFVTCSFGLFFLDDMSKGLEQWFRVCKPGGQVIYTTFGPEALKPVMPIFNEMCKEFGLAPKDEVRHPPVERLKDPKANLELVEKAGFINGKVETRTINYYLANDREWWDMIWNSGARGVFLNTDTKTVERFRQAYVETLKSHADENGIRLTIEVHFVSAQKPD